MFSKATEYAMRATILIAQKSSEENKLGIAEIAKGINSPKSFTAKILQKLTAGSKIISSVRGPNGGFYMTAVAKNLPVRAILEVMEEEEVFGKCVLGLKKCSEAKPCPLHADYQSIKLQLIRLFNTKTIQNLADEMTSGDFFINNK